MKLAGALLVLLAVVGQAQGQEMVQVPGGAFTMGRNDGPADERSSHEVTLASYSIDRLPVTNAGFAEFLNVAGTHNAGGERLFDFDDPDARIHRAGKTWVADKGYEDHPVVEVS